MNRSAIGYIVTPMGIDKTPFIGQCVVEETPERFRFLIDDGGGSHWFPREGTATAMETDDEMELAYDSASGHFGEVGVKLQPVTVDRWNKLAQIRPEMTPVFDFDDMVGRLR